MREPRTGAVARIGSGLAWQECDGCHAGALVLWRDGQWEGVVSFRRNYQTLRAGVKNVQVYR